MVSSPPLPHGLVLLDKPPALTSNQAMAKVRRLFHGKKIGHGGTLDPFATGLLIVALGEATKVLPYILHQNKTYQFTLSFGTATDSQDKDGKVIATSEVLPDKNTIINALPHFTGNIQQTPPVYSAIKIGGKRSYDLARAGQPPALKPRPVIVHSLKLLSQQNQRDFTFEVACGAGLYVRTLGHDLAVYLGSVGHVSALKRTAIGNFLLDDAFSLAKLEKMSYEDRRATALMDFCANGSFDNTKNQKQKNLSSLIGIKTIFLGGEDAKNLRLGKKIMWEKTNIGKENEKYEVSNEEKILLAVDDKKKPIGFITIKENYLVAKRIFVL